MRNFNIKFTTDVHGYFYPTNYRAIAPDNMGLFSVVDSMTAQQDNCLVIDGGDMMQGSPMMQYVANNQLGYQLVADMVNKAQYTHVTLGNHDFNNGYDCLAQYLCNLSAKVVCCNVVDKSGMLPIVPYDIVAMSNGLRVGVVGVVTDYVNVWENKANLTQLEVLDTFSSVASAYSQVAPQCDVTVCVYHGGYEHALDNLDSYQIQHSGENVGLAICYELGFDILLTGHQHMNVAGRYISDTYTLQIPCNASHLADVQVAVDDNGNVSVESCNIPADYHNSNVSVQNMYQPLQDNVQQWLDSPVGNLQQAIDCTDALQLMTNGWDFTNLCNYIVLEQTGADFACSSLQNSPYALYDDITIRDIVCSYPYANIIETVSILGSDIKLALEQVATFFVVDNGKLAINSQYTATKLELYNFDFYYGLDYTIDVSKPEGSRVTHLAVKGKPLDMQQHYTLSLTSYRASGAGGYDMYRHCKRLSATSSEMQELLIDYIVDHGCVQLPAKCNYKVIY